MWFIFGVITLLSFTIYFFYKRLRAAWSGTVGSSKGVSFQYKILTGKYGVTGLLIGVDGPVGYDYSFKKETLIDRFFKFVGFSDEYQIGNKEFDDLVYVVSDNSQLHRQISSSAIIADAVIEIFKLSEKFSCKVREVRNNSGKLWVILKANKGFDEKNVLSQSSQTAGILKSIANEIEHMPQLSTSKWSDPFVIKAAVILAISTGLAVNGVVHLMRLGWVSVPFTLDSDQLLTDSICWGAGIVVALIIVSVMVLGRSARTHLVMIELLLMGTFGAVSTVFTELRDINIEFDESIVAKHEVKALDKKTTKRRRSTSYYLYLNDWNSKEKISKVKVSSSFYRSVSIGEKIIVKQRDGYLNYRWVESLERKI